MICQVFQKCIKTYRNLSGVKNKCGALFVHNDLFLYNLFRALKLLSVLICTFITSSLTVSFKMSSIPVNKFNVEALKEIDAKKKEAIKKMIREEQRVQMEERKAKLRLELKKNH